MKTKKCFKCKKVKSINKFYKHRQLADGYLNKCKECTKKDVLKYRYNNIERIRAYDRKRGDLPHRITARKKYSQTPEGKKALREGNKRWGKRNLLARAAGSILQRAVKTGKIKRQPCEKCNSIIRIHGHHDDYYKPLEVKWLCTKCHMGLHKDQRVYF